MRRRPGGPYRYRVTLLAEDLLLLLIDDASGKPLLDRTRLDRGLAGAVLLELALAERVVPVTDAEPTGRTPLAVRDPSPTGDELLDDGLARLAGRPRKAPRAVELLVRGLHQKLLTRIVAAGFVRAEHGTTLGLFPTTRWPAARPEHKAAVRAALSQVLLVGTTPDRRTAALVSLLNAVDAVPKVVPTDDKRALVRRAREVADGDWAGAAVRKAVDAVHAAVMAAVVAASSAAASS
jgi:hypothetical protein